MLRSMAIFLPFFFLSALGYTTMNEGASTSRPAFPSSASSLSLSSAYACGSPALRELRDERRDFDRVIRIVRVGGVTGEDGAWGRRSLCVGWRVYRRRGERRVARGIEW